jgi:hypothetical protein
MAVRISGDQHSQPDTARQGRQITERRPTLEARSGRITEYRVEVVEGPTGRIQIDLICRLPEVSHRLPPGMLWSGLE